MKSIYKCKKCRVEIVEHDEPVIFQEAEYQGRKVALNKPMQGDQKKFKVYVKDPSSDNIKVVHFGQGGKAAKIPEDQVVQNVIKQVDNSAWGNTKGQSRCSQII